MGFLFFVSFLRASLKPFPWPSTSPFTHSTPVSGSPSTDARQFGNSYGARTRFAAIPVRRAAEPYYALVCFVPSGASRCSWFGPKRWLDGRGAALVKLVHHPSE
jgi:hypothetical protein